MKRDEWLWAAEVASSGRVNVAESQWAIRRTLMAGAVVSCCGSERCSRVLLKARSARRNPKEITPCENVLSMPARRA